MAAARSSSKKPTGAIEEGRAAPAFTLPDQDGKKVSLNDFRGQNVIVYFYPRTTRRAAPRRRRASTSSAASSRTTDAVVLGISPDGPESHQKFRKKYKLDFTLLCDPDKKVMTKYGAFGEKMMYGKKTTGVIRSTVWVGPDGKVRKHWARVAKAGGPPGQGAGGARRRGLTEGVASGDSAAGARADLRESLRPPGSASLRRAAVRARDARGTSAAGRR